MNERDGRAERSVRSRELVAEAWAELMESEPTPPDMDTLSEQSGISVRSIYRLFGDTRTVVDAGIVAQLRRVRPLVVIEASDRASLSVRCDAVATGHGALSEALLNIRHVATDPIASELVGKAMASLRRARRSVLASVFERELERAAAHEGPDRLDAVESASGWATWHGLRFDQRLSRARAQAIVTADLRAILR